jgi:two-component system sensor histidine kinase BaeS
MSFRAKLFLAILATTFLTASLVTLALYRGAGNQLQSYIERQELSRLEGLSKALDDRLDARQWRRLANAPRARQQELNRVIAQIVAQSNAADDTPIAPPHRPRGLRWERQAPEQTTRLLSQTVSIDGESAGALIMPSRTAWQSEPEKRFREMQRRRAALALIIALIISSAVAGLLARALHRPIHALMEKSRQLASGQRQLNWRTDHRDEFGRLHHSLKQLDDALVGAETRQRQWLSDTAHELRTPLSILMGELEALQDGVRPLSQTAVESLLDEVRHLSHMVHTLHQLSLSESGALPMQLELTDLGVWLARQVERHRPAAEKAGHRLLSNVCPTSVFISADPDQLRQILNNLLDNAIRYTQAPGEILVELSRDTQTAFLRVSDSAPGPSSAQLTHIFDRFFRAESARSQTGSGLGLAIVKALIANHGGSIKAERSASGGLQIEIQLPLTGDPNEL